MKGRDGDTLYASLEISPSMVFHHLEKFHFSTLYDPLASTSGGSGYFKLQNLRVISNDLSCYIYERGKALWENNRFSIPDDIINLVCGPADEGLDGCRRFSGFDYPHLTGEMKAWLELWHNRIHREPDEYIHALLCTGVFLCIDYWITLYEHGWEPSFDPPSLLRYYLGHVNRQVMNNHDSNEMWRENPHELTEKVLADAMFLNPPTLKGYSSFGIRERISECWIRGDTGFELSDIAPEGALGSRFDSVSDYMAALSDFLGKAAHIQLWIITLSNRHPFTRVELDEILNRMGKKISLVDIDVPRGFFSPRAAHSVLIASG